VTNRGYIDPSQPHDSTEVVIVADNANPPHPDTQSVVRFVSGETRDAILQGVTIEKGTGIRTEYYNENGELMSLWRGGGIYVANQSEPTIKYCLIRDNKLLNSSYTLLSSGGGIAVVGTGSEIHIEYSEISDNSAGHQGGGIYIYGGNLYTENCWIVRNKIKEPYFGDGGGGGVYFDFREMGTGKMTGDSIAYNECERHTAAGGIWLRSDIISPEFIMRKAKIVNNSCGSNGGGIFVTIAPSLHTIDLGTFDAPGFNLLINNYAAGNPNDLYVYSYTSSILRAEGNYWSTLHTPNIRSRICLGRLAEIDFDPVAASDRVANVTNNSQCSTDVIITGDLTINPEVTLTIAPGRTFYFETMPDCNTGSYPDHCELIVHEELQADGTESEKIRFTSLAPVAQPGDWYGIRVVGDNSRAHFDNCTLKFAYSAIDADNANVSVDSSTIEHNQLAGIIVNSTQTVNIKRSEINFNEVYGIFCGNSTPVIMDNKLIDNGKYGIYLETTNGASVVRNQITGNPAGFTPSLDSIFLKYGENVIMDTNRIEQYNQNGVYFYGSNQVVMHKDTILDNTENGILCSEAASPYVRGSRFASNKTGVYCDYFSYPDLGTIEDAGYNSIDTSNFYWIINENPEEVMAQYNWWGVADPIPFLWKFLGPVAYDPWLTEEPEGQGGGGQSAGIIKPTLTFALYNPKPNPASKEVRIVYSLPSRCESELIIWDISGRIIAKTTDEKDAGNYEYLWNGKDQRGKEVPNGIYLVRFKAGNNLQTQKVALAR
jgi:hypothetical protein